MDRDRVFRAVSGLNLERLMQGLAGLESLYGSAVIVQRVGPLARQMVEREGAVGALILGLRLEAGLPTIGVSHRQDAACDQCAVLGNRTGIRASDDGWIIGLADDQPNCVAQ